ncbi:glycolipid transfer protein domain-containing protein [Mycena amicta]|nr:glycolipid transfer protein domain-containing protein [Mycena amicta]
MQPTPLSQTVSDNLISSRRARTLADTNFFDNSFPSANKESGDYDACEYIDATEAFISIFDILGLSAFSVVKNDFQECIKAFRAALDKEFASAMTRPGLKQLAVTKSTKTTKPLLNTLRGLSFLCKALQDITGPTKTDSTTAFSASYKKYLQKHHDMVETSLYSAAIDACRSGTDFESAVGKDSQKLKESLDALSGILKAVAEPSAFGDKLKCP